MIKRGYIVTYEVWDEDRAISWGTQSWTTKSWFPTNSGEFMNEIHAWAQEIKKCEYNQVRITGVYKL